MCGGGVYSRTSCLELDTDTLAWTQVTIITMLYVCYLCHDSLQTKELVDPEGRWGHVSWDRGDQGVILMGGEVYVICKISICLVFFCLSIIFIYKIYHIYLSRGLQHLPYLFNVGLGPEHL